MKKLFLTTVLALSAFVLFAQNLDKIKDLYKAKKLEEARTQIDQFLAVEKNTKNAEGWYYKAKIYNDISFDEKLSASVPDARKTAFEALKQYVAVDDKSLINLQLDNYKPVTDMYQGYFKDGAAYYNKNDYKNAYPNFKNCLAVSDYMIEKKWSTQTFDTSVVLYTGVSAEKSDMKDEAAIYYGRLAEAKVTGEGMVEIYKWLVDHYNTKKDDVNTQKYLALGKEVYPADVFWDSMELDRLREKGDKKALFAKYEEIIAKNPESHVFRFNYAAELYQEGYSDPDVAKRPANSAELIGKSEEQLKKVVELKPDYTQAQIVLGQLYYNQGVDLNAQVKAIKPPAGGKLKPEELKKKEDLRAEMMKKFDQAVPHLEKIDTQLSPQGKLKMEDKKTLKDALDLLITINDQKGNKDKVKVYEEKFNNVDKVH